MGSWPRGIPVSESADTSTKNLRPCVNSALAVAAGTLTVATEPSFPPTVASLTVTESDAIGIDTTGVVSSSVAKTLKDPLNGFTF